MTFCGCLQMGLQMFVTYLRDLFLLVVVKWNLVNFGYFRLILLDSRKDDPRWRRISSLNSENINPVKKPQ